MRAAAFIVLAALVPASPASAQLVAAKDGPVVYGHHHLNVTSLDAHRKFWIDTLGGTPVKLGTIPNDIVMFPNVLVFLRQQKPTGGTKGTTVNHIAFAVKDVRQMKDKAKAAGYEIVTNEEAGAGDVITDDISFNKAQGSYSAFVMGPDDVKVFGAKPTARGTFISAALPGVELTFAPSTTPVVPTRGRVLDHIGFEVKNLEAFCKKLEGAGITLDRPYTVVPALKLAIAFLYDPWGTYIELNEGLGEVH